MWRDVKSGVPRRPLSARSGLIRPTWSGPFSKEEPRRAGANLILGARVLQEDVVVTDFSTHVVQLYQSIMEVHNHSLLQRIQEKVAALHQLFPARVPVWSTASAPLADVGARLDQAQRALYGVTETFCLLYWVSSKADKSHPETDIRNALSERLEWVLQRWERRPPPFAELETTLQRLDDFKAEDNRLPDNDAWLGPVEDALKGAGLPPADKLALPEFELCSDHVMEQVRSFAQRVVHVPESITARQRVRIRRTPLSAMISDMYDQAIFTLWIAASVA